MIMAYKAKWLSLIFITTLLLSSGTSSSIDAEDRVEIIPHDVACAYRGEDFYSFLLDKIAERVEEDGVNQENLDALKARIITSSIMSGNPSWSELADSIIHTYQIKSDTSKAIIERALPQIFNMNQASGRVKGGLEDEMRGKDRLGVKLAKLLLLKMVMDGKVHKIDVCGTESQVVAFDEGPLLLNLNDFRVGYHGLWLADLYGWFKNRYPNLDQKLFDEARGWKAPMPVFIEGATGDKPADGGRKRDIYFSANVERLGRITSEFKRKPIKWFEIDWSKSDVDVDGKVSHPSIIEEHKNFSAQFMGAVELVHLMEIAHERGDRLEVMAFSAGTNVIVMAAEIYKGLGKKGTPFKGVILVQGSIGYGRDLSPLTGLTSAKGRIVVTRNREDSFYLSAGTRSIGYAGGMELFGKGDSIGYFGVGAGGGDGRIEVWDIYQQPEITKGRKPLLNSEFRGSKVTESAEGEHWHWFAPHNFRRLIKLFFF